MNTKPILLWPRPRSEIERHLDRDDDEFLVVDTNSAYELQKLYKLGSDTPIFDPFPGHGEHYRDFIEHVVAIDCRCHIAGLDVCQDVLLGLKDSSLAHASIGEIFAAMKPAHGHRGHVDGGRRPLIPFVSGSTTKRMTNDWSSLNWVNTGLLTILVFAAALIGNVLLLNGNSLSNSLLAAAVATILFAVFYVSVRTNAMKLLGRAGKQESILRNRPINETRQQWVIRARGI